MSDIPDGAHWWRPKVWTYNSALISFLFVMGYALLFIEIALAPLSIVMIWIAGILAWRSLDNDPQWIYYDKKGKGRKRIK